ncbi:hypothetical protein [Streptomyces sp. Z26]|uniref:hypothetical protein n=1 Tax=Streptomyces sp. Z26 TaxID=2500177 RepID=UPI000EF16438|nr:hypothetical protein [Streptomyces sp. Z26]RLL68116.1 hypothetical protein D7M15_16145 [Streptomyces sp. Z26]
MTEAEACRVQRMLHRMGRPGVAAPVNAGDPDGEWAIFDRAEPALRRDITGEVLDALIDEAENAPTLPAGGHARRGFIVPS